MRLIDADKLVETLRDTVFEYGDTGGSWGSFMPDVCAIVREEPEVDPVKHARWIMYGTANWHYCSNCRAMDEHSKTAVIGYCWRCGARMDGVENETV